MGLELNLLCESGKVIKMGIQSLNSSADTVRKNEFYTYLSPGCPRTLVLGPNISFCVHSQSCIVFICDFSFY